MAGSSGTHLELVAFRAPVRLADEVRKLAQRDAETCASTYRRLLRTALELERSTHGFEAA